jgi:hypothetical protein
MEQETLSVSQFFKDVLCRIVSQDNQDRSVGTMMGWIAENQRFDSRQAYEFSSLHSFRTDS